MRGDVNGCDLRKNPRAILNRASTQRRLFSSPKSRRDDLFVALRMPTIFELRRSGLFFESLGKGEAVNNEQPTRKDQFLSSGKGAAHAKLLLFEDFLHPPSDLAH